MKKLFERKTKVYLTNGKVIKMPVRDIEKIQRIVELQNQLGRWIKLENSKGEDLYIDKGCIYAISDFKI